MHLDGALECEVAGGNTVAVSVQLISQGVICDSPLLLYISSPTLSRGARQCEALNICRFSPCALSIGSPLVNAASLGPIELIFSA